MVLLYEMICEDAAEILQRKDNTCRLIPTLFSAELLPPSPGHAERLAAPQTKVEMMEGPRIEERGCATALRRLRQRSCGLQMNPGKMKICYRLCSAFIVRRMSDLGWRTSVCFFSIT
ncbi:hypothetical protein ILYODFUR_002187 [Ilyodon furcidens]|uniref:Uncharacterized protein n=1 Tax=Ilyodon furcidens TaxID=33524 RepID=A0ABV0UQ76_9TELE